MAAKKSKKAGKKKAGKKKAGKKKAGKKRAGRRPMTEAEKKAFATRMAESRAAASGTKKRSKKKAGKKKAGKKKAGKKRASKRRLTAGCPPEVAVQVKRLADKNAELAAENARLKARPKKKRSKKKASKKKPLTTGQYRHGAHGRVYDLSAKKKATRKKPKQHETLTAAQIEKRAKSRGTVAWICANTQGRRTGCGGGARGGHVVGSTTLSPSMTKLLKARKR